MKSRQRLLIITLAALPLLLPAGAEAADRFLRRLDVAVGLAPLPIPVPILLPEVRYREPEVIYVYDSDDWYYRDQDHYGDRRDDRRRHHEGNRHDRGNHHGHGNRQVVIIDRDDHHSCNARPTTVVVAERGRRW